MKIWVCHDLSENMHNPVIYHHISQFRSYFGGLDPMFRLVI